MGVEARRDQATMWTGTDELLVPHSMPPTTPDTGVLGLLGLLASIVLKHVSALEALRNALYKFSTYLLTYLVLA